MMKFDKHNLSKKFSKFISKIFWHFDQVVPNYASLNHHSVDKSILNSNNNIDHNPIPYVRRYRKRLIQQCRSTLVSIQEENEIELMNCK